MKTAVADRDLLAVAYWGGLVQVVAADGQVRTAQLLPHDVSGLAWLERQARRRPLRRRSGSAGRAMNACW